LLATRRALSLERRRHARASDAAAITLLAAMPPITLLIFAIDADIFRHAAAADAAVFRFVFSYAAAFHFFHADAAVFTPMLPCHYFADYYPCHFAFMFAATPLIADAMPPLPRRRLRR
jgi:hypothetical protein